MDITHPAPNARKIAAWLLLISIGDSGHLTPRAKLQGLHHGRERSEHPQRGLVSFTDRQVAERDAERAARQLETIPHTITATLAMKRTT